MSSSLRFALTFPVQTSFSDTIWGPHSVYHRRPLTVNTRKAAGKAVPVSTRKCSVKIHKKKKKKWKTIDWGQSAWLTYSEYVCALRYVSH